MDTSAPFLWHASVIPWVSPGVSLSSYLSCQAFTSSSSFFLPLISGHFPKSCLYPFLFLSLSVVSPLEIKIISMCKAISPPPPY